jgi:DNA-binding PadR family transcriptional regulator
MAIVTLTSLEIMLLALVDRGWSTPYRLKEAAGISVGAALPALNRLLGRGLLKRAEIAARNKQEFEVTPAGKKVMNSEIKRLFKQFKQTPPNDVESVIRLATLALFTKRCGTAVALLKGTGEARRRIAKLRSEEAGQLVTTDLAALYRNMSEACDVARSEAEATAIITLANKVKRLKIS